MTKIRAYLAISADGFIADAQGGVGWLETFQGGEFGYKEFYDAVEIIISGRVTYEQVLGFGEWPYSGKRLIVMTGKELPIPEGADGVEFSKEDTLQLLDRLRSETTGDIWLLGGADLVQRFLAAGAVDTLELYVMPVLLGSGIPLTGNQGSSGKLELIQTRAMEMGAVELIYQVGK